MVLGGVPDGGGYDDGVGGMVAVEAVVETEVAFVFLVVEVVMLELVAWLLWKW